MARILTKTLVGFFMLFTFSDRGADRDFSVPATVAIHSKASVNQKILAPPAHAAMPGEFRPPQPRALGEPLPSVTENTTRTLEYSRTSLRN